MKIAMIILAAGFSERMGVLKPLLPVGGESALIRAVHLARHEKIHCISVVTGYRCEDVEAELQAHNAKNIRHIYNNHFAEGMFTSVKAGIHSLPGDIDGFFLLPVDHCAVQAETLEKVIAAFVLSDGQSIMYPTYNDERGHPPLIPYSFTAGIKAYDGEGGMQGFLASLPFEEVCVNDRGILLDMDTPRDYEALLTHLGLPSYPYDKACYQLFDKYNVPQDIRAHGETVRTLALRMANLLCAKGVNINADLLSSACLLHDMARQEPDHELAAAKLLLKEGYPAAARLVAAHMDLPDDYTPKPDETALLYLSDKLSRSGGIRTLDETLIDLRARYASEPDALAAAEGRMRRAHAILEMLNIQYQIDDNDIIRRPAE